AVTPAAVSDGAFTRLEVAPGYTGPGKGSSSPPPNCSRCSDVVSTGFAPRRACWSHLPITNEEGSDFRTSRHLVCPRRSKITQKPIQWGSEQRVRSPTASSHQCRRGCAVPTHKG